MSDEQVLPHSLEAEQSVLGAILLHGDVLETAAEVLVPSDFYRHAHQRIYAAMLSLQSKRQPVELVTVREALSASGELESVNGPAYLASLVDGMPRASNIVAYAQVVRQKATLREIVSVARTTLSEALAASESASTVLDAAQQRLFEVAVEREARGFVSIVDIVQDEVFPTLERLMAQKTAVSGVPSGLLDLDHMTRGFQPADLIIVAARPSMGKTGLAMCAAVHAAAVAEKHVGVFSLEMSRADLALRAVIAEAQIDGMRVRQGRIGESDWARLSQALGSVSASRLHIDDSARLTVHEIRARARRLKAQVGLDILIIDYLQLIRASERGENRNIEIADISSALKGIAKDLQIPVVALSQLSRACEARADKRPMLSDLRDSGALEQDADLVISIYRDEVYRDDTSDKGIAELDILKQRNGPTGMVKVGFDRFQTRFYNLQRGAAA